MRTKSTRLSLERMDERDVPACIVGLGAPDTLVVTGNAASDTVIINDNGAGVITGSATGWGAFTFSGIKQIQVNTWAGNDHVVYNLTRNLGATQQRTVSVQLGAGNDAFTANLFNPRNGVGSDLLEASRLTISAAGGEGNDSLRVNALHDVDVTISAALNVNLLGESGHDAISADYHGQNNGLVALRGLNGGTGNDSIHGSIQEDVGSVGASIGLAQGGDGDDRIGLFMATQHPPLLALLDGGAGTDMAGHTANVTVVNVP